MRQTIDDVINTLDFSGGNNSWFDLWHTHLDWNGEGNKSWQKREKYLTKHIELYHKLSEKLKTYPHPFQLWVEIDEEDADQDAVYIHTPNPNEDNFPLTISSAELPAYAIPELKRFIEQQELSVKGIKTQGGNVYLLYNEHIGRPL
jgi:hypothetical protein